MTLADLNKEIASTEQAIKKVEQLADALNQNVQLSKHVQEALGLKDPFTVDLFEVKVKLVRHAEMLNGILSGTEITWPPKFVVT